MPVRACRIALGVNGALAFLSFIFLMTRAFGYPRPSVGMMIFDVSLPWLAVGAVLMFPQWFLIFPALDERRICLFGLLFWSALTPIADYYYAPLIHRLPALELGAAEGAFLLLAIYIAERRANGFPALWVIAAMPCFAYGVATVEQMNCLLDHSPPVVYRTTISSKFGLRYRSGPKIYLKPWGPHPEPRTIFTSYSTPVSRDFFDRVESGGEVCIVEREGALGLAWYTVHTCPWDGLPVVLGLGGSM